MQMKFHYPFSNLLLNSKDQPKPVYFVTAAHILSLESRACGRVEFHNYRQEYTDNASHNFIADWS